MPLASIGRRRWLQAAIGIDRCRRSSRRGPGPIRRRLPPIRTLCDALLRIMHAGSGTPFPQRFAMLAPVIDQVFDLPAILQVSVGPTWSSLPPDQQARC